MANDPSSAARELGRRGAAKGGRARASVLTSEERSAIARQAARARWGQDVDEPDEEEETPDEEPTDSEAADRDGLPISLFPGTLELGDVALDCHVLNDGRRVLTASAVTRAITGRTNKTASLGRYLARVPHYSSSMLSGRTIRFRIPANPQVAIGYEATLLIEICEMYLSARDQGLLKPSQYRLAEAAEVIVRACARVGIIALIDEATDYQKIREKRALQIKLQAFIAEHMQDWVKTFPEEFWYELARLEGVRYSPRNRPIRWGRYVMQFVYDSIDPDLGKKLRELNPNPRHRKNHHQWLREFDRDRLHQQLGGVIATMKACKDMDDFRRRFKQVFQRNGQLELEGLEWLE